MYVRARVCVCVRESESVCACVRARARVCVLERKCMCARAFVCVCVCARARVRVRVCVCVCVYKDNAYWLRAGDFPQHCSVGTSHSSVIITRCVWSNSDLVCKKGSECTTGILSGSHFYRR